MLEMILNIALVVVGFSFIIAIHELGHFLAAKRAGIECPVYSIGFPLPPIKGLPKRFRNIFSIHWRGTDYRLGWIPFGGFVQMKGQSDTPDELDNNDGATDDFRNVSYGNKVLVICGGVIMNALTGVVFFILAFAVFGVTYIAPTVGAVVPTDSTDTSEVTTLWKSGLVHPGDEIIAVNGEPVTDYEDAAYAAFFDEDGVIQMTFRDPDTKVETSLDVDLYTIHTKLDAKLPPVMMSSQVMAGEIEAEASGGVLHKNDEVLKINGFPLKTTADIQGASNLIKKGEAATLTVLRDGREMDVSYTPRSIPFKHSDSFFGLSFASTLKILGVQDLGPAAEAGLQAGDEILSLHYPSDTPPGTVELNDGWSTTVSQPALKEALRIAGEATPQRKVTMRIKRGEETLEIAVAPKHTGTTPGLYAISIIFDNAALIKSMVGATSLTVASVDPQSAAWKAGVRAGDKIIDFPNLNSSVVSGGVWGFFESNTDLSLYQRIGTAANQMLKAVGADNAKTFGTVKVRIERDGEQQDLEIAPTLDDPNARALFVFAARTKRTSPIVYSAGEAIGVGLQQTDKNMKKILLTLKGLVTGRVSPTQLAGPVMIAKASYDLTQYGFGTLLFFLGFISINLAVVNILPIPVLDGGLLLIVTLEKIKGGPLNERVMGLVNLVSFLCVIGLMLFVVFNDIRNLIIL